MTDHIGPAARASTARVIELLRQEGRPDDAGRVLAALETGDPRRVVTAIDAVLDADDAGRVLAALETGDPRRVVTAIDAVLDGPARGDDGGLGREHERMLARRGVTGVRGDEGDLDASYDTMLARRDRRSRSVGSVVRTHGLPPAPLPRQPAQRVADVDLDGEVASYRRRRDARSRAVRPPGVRDAELPPPPEELGELGAEELERWAAAYEQALEEGAFDPAARALEIFHETAETEPELETSNL